MVYDKKKLYRYYFATYWYKGNLHCMKDIFQVLCHIRKLIEVDTSRYAQVYVCQSSHKFSVTTLEQNGP